MNYISLNKRQSDIHVCKKAMFIILLTSCILENILFFDENSIIVSVTSLLSLIIFNRVVFQLNVIRDFPISFFVLTNLFLFMYLPIPVTLLDGISVSHDMYNPTLTYLLQFLYYVMAIFAFSCAISNKTKIFKKTAFIYKMGFFQKITIPQLWILGFLGCIPRLLLMIAHTEFAAGLLSTLSYLMYAPIVILFMPLIGGYEASKMNKILAYCYIGFIMFLFIGSNARHLLITPLIIIIGCYVIKYFQSDALNSVFKLKNVILTILVLFIVSGPLSDVATAMVLVRSVRADVSFNELISETITMYQDKQALDIAKKMSVDELGKSATLSNNWDENYTSNVFLQRFCNYRVVDASIYHALRVDMPSVQMIKASIRQLEKLPPTPIPKLLFNINKDDPHFSAMDYLYAYSTHTAPHGMLRVGGDVGLGLSVFGIFYFIVQFLVYYLLFILLCSMAFRRNEMLVVSVFAICQLMDLFNLMTVHSGLIRHISFLIWGFWYNAILLIIVTKLVKMFSFKRESV